MTAPVITIPENPSGGRDFVFGDIHGCFGTVEHALEALSHHPDRDRLFSLGDLIDYGTRSHEALKWIGSRFTATVRGNHEQMMIEWLWNGSLFASDAKIWREHWTSWWFRSSEPAEVRWRWFDALQSLPFAATIHTAGGTRIGLVHGYPSLRDDITTWDGLCAALENEGARDTSGAVGPNARSAMWDRPPTYADRGVSGLQNIELVLHGHDPAPEPRWTAERTLCIDTAVQWPDKPTSGQTLTPRSESSSAPVIAARAYRCSPFSRAFTQPPTTRARTPRSSTSTWPIQWCAKRSRPSARCWRVDRWPAGNACA